MPVTIQQLQQEHDQFLKLNPDRQLDLATFAKSADELYGTPGERAAGYNWGKMDAINYKINELISPVSEVTRDVGAGVGSLLDSAAGTGKRIEDTLAGVGEGLPRFVGEAALTAIPVAGPIGRAASLAAKGAGYGSAFIRGTAEQDSVVGGAVEVATLGAGNLLLPKLDKMAVEAVNKRLYARLSTELEGAAGAGAEELAKVLANQTAGEAIKANVARTGARVAADTLGGTALGEANRQAQLTVAGAPISERDPFTLENVVGNVAGSVGFAPIPIIAGLRRPGIDLERVAQVSKWAESTGRVAAPAQDSFGSALDRYIEGRKTGDTAVMGEGVGQMRAAEKVGKPEPVEFMAATSNLYNDAVARGVLPSDLNSFVKAVNDLIDQRSVAVSRETDSAKTIRLKRDPKTGKMVELPSNYKAGFDDPADLGINVEPVGPSAAAVNQLQEKNYLPKITPEWLQSTFDKHLQRSLTEDPAFAYKAMVSEVSNKLLDLYDDAHAKLVKETNTQPVKSSRDAERETQRERDYIDALATIREMSQQNKLPPDVANALLQRHLQIVNFVTKTREGHEASGYASWREAVVEAVENYDSETGKTTLTFGNKKKGELVTREIQFEDLVKKNKDGGYVINPKLRRYTRAMGGKSTLEQADVGFTQDSPTPSDIAQSQIYEDFGSEPQQWVDEGVTKGDTGDALPVEDKLPADAVIAPSTKPENAVATQLRERTAAMTSMDLFKLMEPWMRPGRTQEVVVRNQTYAREAFGALLDLMGEKSYLSKESIDFARTMHKDKFDALVAKKGEREAVRVAVATFWDSTAEKMWSRFRPGEAFPTGDKNIRKFEPILERILGPKSLDELKTSRMAWDTVSGTDQIGLATKGRTASSQMDTLVDVAQAFRKHFRGQGFEAPLADHFTEIATRMVAAYKDVRFAFGTIPPSDLHMGRFDRLKAMDNVIQQLRVAGVYTTGFMGQYGFEKSPLIGLALDHSKGRKDPYTAAFMLSVLGHEIIHGIEHAAKATTDGDRAKLVSSGPYQQQRIENYRKMFKLSETLTPLQRYEMLTTLAEAVFPLDATGKRAELDSFLRTASTQANETINLYGQMLVLGKLTKTADNPTNYVRDVKDWLKWQPEEVQHFTQGFYRDLSDHADALSYFVQDDALVPVMKEFHNAASKMLHIEDVVAARKTAAMFVANLSAFPDRVPEVKAGIWREEPTGGWTFAPPQFMANAERLQTEGVGQANNFLWAPPGTQIGRLTYLMPFFQLMEKMQKRGITLAGDVWTLLADVQPGYSRAQTKMLEPLLYRTPDGKLEFNNDNPMIRLATASQKDPQGMAARRTLNEILAWQQDNDSTLAVKRDEKGQLAPTREAAPYLNKQLEKIPVQLRQTVLASVDAMNQVYQRSKDVLFQGQVSRVDYRMARLTQSLRPDLPYEQHLAFGRQLTQAATQAVQQVANTNVPAAAQFIELTKGLDPVLVDAAGRYFFEGEGVAPKLVELKEFLDRRPGFASEQRPGRFLIESVTKDGERQVDGAETHAHSKVTQRRLVTAGNTITKVVDKNDARALTNFDAPDQVYEKAVAAEQASWDGFLTRMEGSGKLRGDQLATLKDEYVPGEGLAKQMSVRGLGKFTQERQFVGGRERLDYIDAMRGYVQSLAGSVSRTEARNKLKLILNDKRLANENDFKARTLQQLDWVMTPDSEQAAKVKAGLAAYYLGGNLSSMLIEGTQSAVTLVPQLLSQGGHGYGLGSAWKTVANAGWEAFSLSSKESIGTYVVAAKKIKDGVALNPTEERTYWFRKALDDGILDHGAIQDVYDRDQRALMARKFGHGDYGDTTLSTMVGNKVYQASQFLLAAYGKMSNFNQKVAFAAGLKQGQELGLVGEKLYEHARRTKDLSMFGGGKANQPGALALISNPHTKSALGVMYTLQQYGLGMTSHLFERMRESFDRSGTLTPVQKLQARKAFGTMVATQTALAGALGLPFVGATLAVIEQVFGVNANAAVREGLASLAGDDEELGGLISEVALDGIASQTLGVDLASRVGVSNLLGTSAYRGFSFVDMLGPAPSVIGNMVNGVKELSSGNYWAGAKELVPQAFKNSLGLAKSQSQYGDLAFRDKSSNLLYEPTGREAAAYAIGFRPRELAQKQRLQGLLKTSEDIYQRGEDTTLDRLARSLREGNGEVLAQFVDEQYRQDPMFDEKTLMTKVINRAVNMDVPVDPLAIGSRGNQAKRRQIASTFDPNIVDRREEVTKALRADELNATTGYRAGAPITARELMRAEMIDMLVERGMTRTQALQELEVMRL